MKQIQVTRSPRRQRRSESELDLRTPSGRPLPY
jgi:hypothetical protein